jgi:brefeldin A-inhibited guanine nucleotide-exchange protein
MRTSTLRQKIVLLNVLQRLCQDPQALVEIYLNYDCDREATENIYERCAPPHTLYQSTPTDYYLS